MADDKDLSEERTELAESRTDWAEDRTILANERTFAGWMRTGMASLAVAIGLKAVFGDFSPTWIAKAAATIFVVCAIAIFVAAAQRSQKTQVRIDSHSTDPQPSRRMMIIAGVFVFGSLAIGAILWLL